MNGHRLKTDIGPLDFTNMIDTLLDEEQRMKIDKLGDPDASATAFASGRDKL